MEILLRGQFRFRPCTEKEGVDAVVLEIQREDGEPSSEIYGVRWGQRQVHWSVHCMFHFLEVQQIDALPVQPIYGASGEVLEFSRHADGVDLLITPSAGHAPGVLVLSRASAMVFAGVCVTLLDRVCAERLESGFSLKAPSVPAAARLLN